MGDPDTEARMPQASDTDIKYVVVASKLCDCVDKERIERDVLAVLNKFSKTAKLTEIKMIPMRSLRTRKTLFKKREVPAKEWVEYRAYLDVAGMTKEKQAILKALFEAFVMGRYSGKQW